MTLLLGASVAAFAQTSPAPATSGGQKNVPQLINGKKITLPPVGVLTQPLGLRSITPEARAALPLFRTSAATPRI